MLKSRNSFFSESNMNSINYVNPNPSNMNYMMPNVQTQSASNSFYQGPAVMPETYPNYLNYPTQTGTNQQINDYDNRLAKLERSINSLDARITKLENKAQMTTDEITNNLYMV